MQTAHIDTQSPADAIVATLIARARAAQAKINGYTQVQTDFLVSAAGWAILEPGRNRALAELAVKDTSLGNVADKITKNHRKTLGLLRDLHGALSAGVIAEDKARGITEIARPVGVVAAITPSTNPGATPANKIINALKGRNAVIIAPSPKGWSTCALLLRYIHAEFDKLGAPHDLVQMLPAPVTKDTTHALMRQADLVVATGSQANIRAAYTSGTPAFGVGAGNVASIIDASADLDDAAAKIARSKTFDNATSCSSENSAVIDQAVYPQALAALTRAGGVLLTADEKARLQTALWPGGKLSATLIAQSAPVIAKAAGLTRPELAEARFLMVEESGFGKSHPFSGEKLSPVLTVYRATNFSDAARIVGSIYDFQGAGHSVSLHSKRHRATRISRPTSESLPRDRQSGPRDRDRRQLRQRPAVLAVDGLRHVGRQQLLRQHDLQALSQHHAHRAADQRACAEDRGRARRIPENVWGMRLA